MVGGGLKFNTRATTVQDKPEKAKVTFEIKDPKGQTIMTQAAESEVLPFAFTNLTAEAKLPEGAVGSCTWTMFGGDGKELAKGKFEGVTAEELTKRQMEKATTDIKAQLDALKKESGAKNDEGRRM